MTLRILLLACAFALGCQTPDGPRLGLPDQRLDVPAPSGLARVVFFNTSNKALYPASGFVRIQLNGSTIPTVNHDRYTQIFLEPGEYDLLLQHVDLVTFTSKYRITVDGPDLFIAAYSQLVSTGFKVHKQLPARFEQHWRPAKLPTSGRRAA